DIWTCESIIDLNYFNKIYISPKGKLIIYNNKIHEVIRYDINTLSIETHIVMDWDHTLEDIGFSDDEKLLLINSDGFHLIEPNHGGIVLVMSSKVHNSSIIRNFCCYLVHCMPSEKQDDPKIFEVSTIQDDQINNLSSGGAEIAKMINDELNKDQKEYIGEKELKGYSLQWKLVCESDSVSLKAFQEVDHEDKQVAEQNIFPTPLEDGKKFVLQCELLKNDNL
ncbi:35646_t:CDS:2, partial [Racocetra persica]